MITRIIGAGSALLDILAHVPEEFVDAVPGAKGGMELVDREERDALLDRLPTQRSTVPGGSAANTIVGLARLGIPARLLTKVGTDPLGAFYTDALARNGVETSACKQHPTEATGTCISLVTPDSERTMRTFLGASATLSPGDIGPADFAGCGHAHIEGYLLYNAPAMAALLQAAKTAGCTISIDLASPEVVNACRDELPEMLAEYADMIFANETEASAFTGSDDPEVALGELAAVCDIAVVKLGVEGSLIRRGNDVDRVQAKRVDAVDTTGAGDLWAAGFLFGLYSGLSLAAAGTAGSIVAAAVVQQMGAVIPPETWARIRHDLSL